MKDYYQTLGVAKTANAQEIKRAFRKLAHQYHPDKNGGGNEAKFKEINEAYQILSDPKKREQYDQFGTNFEGTGAGPSGFGGFDFNNFRTQGFNVNFNDFDLGDIFSDMFGFGGRTRPRPSQRRGADIEVDLELDFDKVFTGAKETLRLRKEVRCSRCQGEGAEPGSKKVQCPTCKGAGHVRRVQQTILGAFAHTTVCPDCGGEGVKMEKPCTRCSGTGRTIEEETITVQIPAGIRDGQTIRLDGRGQAGERGATPGDLYLKIHLKPSPYFERKGDDIISELPVSFTQAALGGEVMLKTWNREAKVKIPKGTQSGKILKLSGKGVPHLEGRGAGDHLLKVKVVTPTRLSQREKELLTALEDEGGQTARPRPQKEGGFWNFF